MKKATGMNWRSILKNISPYNLKKAYLYMRHFGLSGFFEKLTDRFADAGIPYGEWRKEHAATAEELQRQAKTVFADPVRFSILVPLYQTPEQFLRRMLDSVLEQSYGGWELVLADASPLLSGEEKTALSDVVRGYQQRDARIRYRILEKNGGISENTNRALEMAEGAYVCFLDHDDLLEPDALFELAKAVREHPDADLLYTDEDKTNADESEFFQPHFKPDLNPDLLCANNYICHFLAVRTSLARELGGLDPAFDGAQDHDFIFRASERAQSVVHIPRVLYHWRVHASSTADNPFSKEYAFEAGKRAVEAHLARCGERAQVSRLKDAGFYRVRYEIREKPMVSVIIPNKDHPELLAACVGSIWQKTSYADYEILVVENNSEDAATFRYYEELEKQASGQGRRLKVLRWPGRGFCYPAINNFGAAAAAGEYLILLNNDVTVISNDWMEEMLGVCSRPGTGIVGARLYYPDDTIQHAGIIVGIGGVAGNVFVGLKRQQSGYMHKAALMQDLSAVTAACMMVKKSVYEELGGMEERLSVAFNDVDLCLRAREAGFLVVYDPYVEMYHHESSSRGAEDDEKKIRRFQKEIEFMRTRWINILKDGDPYYNPNLSLKTWHYELRR